jgi:hypothetical protein
MDRNGEFQLPCSFRQALHLVLEPSDLCRIIAEAHITQGREAVAHVLLRQVQTRQRFGGGALKDLLWEIESGQT